MQRFQSANQQKSASLREQRTQLNREAPGRLRLRKTRVAGCARFGGTAQLFSAACKQTVTVLHWSLGWLQSLTAADRPDTGSSLN